MTRAPAGVFSSGAKEEGRENQPSRVTNTGEGSPGLTKGTLADPDPVTNQGVTQGALSALILHQWWQFVKTDAQDRTRAVEWTRGR